MPQFWFRQRDQLMISLKHKCLDSIIIEALSHYIWELIKFMWHELTFTSALLLKRQHNSWGVFLIQLHILHKCWKNEYLYCTVVDFYNRTHAWVFWTPPFSFTGAVVLIPTFSFRSLIFLTTAKKASCTLLFALAPFERVNNQSKTKTDSWKK